MMACPRRGISEETAEVSERPGRRSFVGPSHGFAQDDATLAPPDSSLGNDSAESTGAQFPTVVPVGSAVPRSSIPRPTGRPRGMISSPPGTSRAARSVPRTSASLARLGGSRSRPPRRMVRSSPIPRSSTARSTCRMPRATSTRRTSRPVRASGPTLITRPFRPVVQTAPPTPMATSTSPWAAPAMSLP